MELGLKSWKALCRLAISDLSSVVIQGASLVFRRTLLRGIIMSRPVSMASLKARSRSSQDLRDVNKSDQ